MSAGGVGELHGVLEDLHETLDRVAGDGPNIDDETVPGDVVPLSRQLHLVGLVFSQGDHVQMRMQNHCHCPA